MNYFKPILFLFFVPLLGWSQTETEKNYFVGKWRETSMMIDKKGDRQAADTKSKAHFYEFKPNGTFIERNSHIPDQKSYTIGKWKMVRDSILRVELYDIDVVPNQSKARFGNYFFKIENLKMDSVTFIFLSKGNPVVFGYKKE